MTTLVAGSTGLVGALVSQRLAAGGPVRALVRPTSDPVKRAALAAAGAEIVEGDLKDPESLERACRGVRTVITTVSTTLSAQPGDSIEATDQAGQLNLVAAAEAAGAEHMILLSFNEQPVDSPLQRAKRAVEQRMMAGGMAWTILRPSFFTDVWLGPALGFDYANRTARVYGDGTMEHPWIAVSDVVGYVVGAVGNDKAVNAIFDLGGPHRLSARAVVGMFEQRTGDAFTVEEVPVEALRADYEAATDSMAQSFASLMLAYALGTKLDPEPATVAIPLDHRGTVAEYVARVAV